MVKTVNITLFKNIKIKNIIKMEGIRIKAQPFLEWIGWNEHEKPKLTVKFGAEDPNTDDEEDDRLLKNPGEFESEVSKGALQQDEAIAKRNKKVIDREQAKARKIAERKRKKDEKTQRKIEEQDEQIEMQVRSQRKQSGRAAEAATRRQEEETSASEAIYTKPLVLTNQRGQPIHSNAYTEAVAKQPVQYPVNEPPMQETGQPIKQDWVIPKMPKGNLPIENNNPVSSPFYDKIKNMKPKLPSIGALKYRSGQADDAYSKIADTVGNVSDDVFSIYTTVVEEDNKNKRQALGSINEIMGSVVNAPKSYNPVYETDETPDYAVSSAYTAVTR